MLNKEQLYQEIMDNISLIVKQKLNEAFGVKEYSNKEYNNEIKDIAEKIYNLFSNKKLKHNCSLFENNTYFSIYTIFKLFMNYLPDNIKNEFANNDIKGVYSRLRPDFDEINKYPYNKSFKDNGEFNVLSFNMLMEYHIGNIYNIFLKRAISIGYNYMLSIRDLNKKK